METVVLPSPAGVGEIAETRISLFFSYSCLLSRSYPFKFVSGFLCFLSFTFLRLMYSTYFISSSQIFFIPSSLNVSVMNFPFVCCFISSNNLSCQFLAFCFLYLPVL